MDSKIQNHVLKTFLLVLLTIFLLSTALTTYATAPTSIEINPVNNPNGAVILIVDGLGSPYIYPEFTPYAIDEIELEKARVHNISYISQSSSRVLYIRAPQTYTEAGHSVLVTGNSDAEGEIIRYADSTIYDSARHEGFLCLAILEKGDFRQMREEQDIVIFDETNSINSPSMEIEVNHEGDDRHIKDIEGIMLTNADHMYDLVNTYPEGSGERYDAYNRWSLDTATNIIDYMAENAPAKKYILTVNAGAVDTSGHYRGSDGYIENIEGIDATIMPLYDKCIENELTFIITADHGMAFTSEGARGGHKSDKYAPTDEAQLVPLIIHSQDIENGVMEGNFGQEDIAPTILSVLNIPDRLRFADGEAIPVKSYANIQVSLPEKSDVELIREDVVLASGSGDREYLFLGVESGYSYTVRVLDGDLPEQEIFVDSDAKVEFETEVQTPEDIGFLQNKRHLIGAVLILLINLAGLLLIVRIYRE